MKNGYDTILEVCMYSQLFKKKRQREYKIIDCRFSKGINYLNDEKSRIIWEEDEGKEGDRGVRETKENWMGLNKIFFYNIYVNHHSERNE